MIRLSVDSISYSLGTFKKPTVNCLCHLACGRITEELPIKTPTGCASPHIPVYLGIVCDDMHPADPSLRQKIGALEYYGAMDSGDGVVKQDESVSGTISASSETFSRIRELSHLEGYQTQISLNVKGLKWRDAFPIDEQYWDAQELPSLDISSFEFDVAPRRAPNFDDATVGDNGELKHEILIALKEVSSKLGLCLSHTNDLLERSRGTIKRKRWFG